MMTELIIDSFAGGGGASLGISWAIGRCPDIAINHDAAAIKMHAANHPASRHYTEDVWKVAPREVTGMKPVGLLWASPDCKHFSRAKGAKPVEKKIRSLAWVVCKWAAEAKPRIIMLENVREFEDWGPLVPRWECRDCQWKGTEGQAKLARRRRACPRCDSHALKHSTDKKGQPEFMPDPARKGITFRRFVARLKAAGYKVEWKVLNAADYGAPTHRRRLFLIARRDGMPIVWPAPTHGDPKKLQLDLLTRHLKPYRTAAECIDWERPCPSIFDRKKPLAEATMRRIALGVKRYVLENPQPFIVDMQRENRPKGTDEPMGVVTTQDNRFNLVTPFLAPLTHQGEGRGSSADTPLPTITAAHRGEQALVMPLLARTAYKNANGSYVNSVEEPMRTLTAQRDGASVVAAFLAQYNGERDAKEVRATGMDRPINTIPTENRFGLVATNLIHLKNHTKPTGMDEPLNAILASGTHAALVYSFLIKYFGTGIGQLIDDPLHTVATKEHFGLVMVYVSGEPYVIVDIGMRMLAPRELARGQGFPDSYVLTGSNTSQVARIGNSVSPVMADALVSANYFSVEQRRAA